MQVFYDNIVHNNDCFYYAYTNNGLCFIGTPNKDFSEIKQFISDAEFSEQKNSQLRGTLLNYLDGKSKGFNVDLDLSWATSFQKSVYQQLQKVKYGQTVTYEELASNLGKPTATRAVASAVAKNPILFVIPCHRVIRKDGSLGGFRAGLPLKQALLDLEASK
ncbi:methylated-DNA--[protein]-cysteine S-methyltransferase [Lactobacillus sp. YT155]|uniref:methylated-DNA--[protein]-cysteine S-methyltransferase n=1 Tax=Lactobacillus sp. YT155 TaxID=3060955 RepID=UPI00265E6D98|nr:methylated-DNA--[protein]-cysteine S-methyltransferase [Lactobacillus sp. YT155]MDO1604477.1 methylated-DNA--[protein]-cysteine S-methyltransferase [Lactobacillus sp. YT155]